MAKRFTDTNKYKKPFVRGLQGAYKLFWDFLYHDCDNAGLWIVDFEIAQMYLGKDMKVNQKDALKFFNNGEERVIEIDNGKKWFIPSFIIFQYGSLSSNNKAHNGVILALKSYGLLKEDLTLNSNSSPLEAPLQGAMEKEKDKDMEKVKEKVAIIKKKPLDIYLENNKGKLSEIFKELPTLKTFAYQWLEYKFTQGGYKETKWAVVMVSRANKTSTEFIIERITETIAGESYQDYFYSSHQEQFNKRKEKQPAFLNQQPRTTRFLSPEELSKA